MLNMVPRAVDQSHQCHDAVHIKCAPHCAPDMGMCVCDGVSARNHMCRVCAITSAGGMHHCVGHARAAMTMAWAMTMYCGSQAF